MDKNESNLKENSSFVFKLPLTDEEKQTVIEILRKDFVFERGNTSFQLREHTIYHGYQRKYEPTFEEKVAAEKRLKKTALVLAESGALDAITVAFAVSWNRKDDFAVVRKIVRKYTDDEYEYYRERDKELNAVFAIFSRFKILDNYVRKNTPSADFTELLERDMFGTTLSERMEMTIIINGEKYTIPKERLVELKNNVEDRMILKQLLLGEAFPVQEGEDIVEI